MIHSNQIRHDSNDWSELRVHCRSHTRLCSPGLAPFTSCMQVLIANAWKALPLTLGSPSSKKIRGFGFLNNLFFSRKKLERNWKKSSYAKLSQTLIFSLYLLFVYNFWATVSSPPATEEQSLRACMATKGHRFIQIKRVIFLFRRHRESSILCPCGAYHSVFFPFSLPRIDPALRWV